MRQGQNRFITLLLNDWAHRLTVLLSGIFLLQFVIWLAQEEYVWLPETVLYIKITLVIVGVLEILLYRAGGYRLWLQAAAVAIYTYVAVDYTPAAIREPSFQEQLWDFLGHPHPFIWFTLGTWIIYITTIYWVQVRWRIYLLMFISIMAMAVRDSFSQIYLWKQVAVVIACGLCLLIIRHFIELRRRNPIGWAYLADYPATVGIPIVLLLVFTIVPGVFAPNVSNILTDPYTLWKNWKGEQVSFNGKGFSSILNDLDASSGYGRNDDQLGGGFNFDYSPIMTVETTHRSYWRGEVRSVYTGSGWEQSAAEKLGPSSEVRPSRTLRSYPRFKDSLTETVEVRQTVTMLREDTYPVLFGAYAIQQADEVMAEPGFERLLWMERSSELRWTERPSRPYPTTYTLVSQVPIVREGELRNAHRPVNPGEMAEYLQLPDSVPDRVRGLAQEITKDEATPYDQVKAIERYLQTNFKYTNNPNSNGSDSMDFVDRFLFEIQEGYCDYFSSAMVVMTRSIGMPARWVKGFAPGSLSFDENIGLNPYEEMDPNGAGLYTVRNSDAHSWVEVYFEGYGWIPFEPTAGFALPVLAQPSGEDNPQPELDEAPESLPESEDVPADEPFGNRGTQVLIGWIAAAGLLLAAAAVGMTRWGRTRIRRIVFRELPASGLRQQIIVEYNRFIRHAKRKGRRAHDYETARETIQRWANQQVWASGDMLKLLGLFEKAKYSGSPITREEYEQTVALVKKLKEIV